MLNGHSGSMSTGHANNPTDMLHRLETMMLMGIDLPLQAIQRQVASALDIIIHLGRLRDKTRREMKTDRLSISQKKEQYGIQIISAAIFNYLFNMFNTQNYKI